MNEDKATRFHRLRRRAAIAAAGWSVLLLALLLATGWSALLRDTAHGVLESSFVPAFLVVPAIAVVYALTVALAHEAVAFPLAFFTGFILERRYGLSRQTAGEWGRDHLKALGLGLLFGGLSAGFVYLALTLWPDRWWLATTAGAVIVSLILTWLAPVVLIPLFFKVTPLQNDSLSERLNALVQRVGTGTIGIYEWRLSQKTSRANAALTGFGQTRRILLSDTLVGDYSEDEIEVILAHELSHHVSHDVWRALVLEAVVVGLGFWAGNEVLRRSIEWLGLGGVADVAGLPVLVLTAMGVSVLALPLVNAISRWHERRADQFALDITRNPAAFTSAMKRLGAGNLAEENPPAFARLFFYTHPPLGDRLDFARAWSARQMKKGSDRFSPPTPRK
ncbi:MAG: M48 family metalloprotease [Acidobacteria bacterium]|nr:M48 family metalloprotease [Acidobacteriota bacterium]